MPSIRPNQKKGKKLGTKKNKKKKLRCENKTMVNTCFWDTKPAIFFLFFFFSFFLFSFFLFFFFFSFFLFFLFFFFSFFLFFLFFVLFFLSFFFFLFFSFFFFSFFLFFFFFFFFAFLLFFSCFFHPPLQLDGCAKKAGWPCQQKKNARWADGKKIQEKNSGKKSAKLPIKKKPKKQKK